MLTVALDQLNQGPMIDTKYREYRKNATQEERDAFEHKLIDAIEKDGIKAEAEAEARGTTKTKTQ